ncbi:MAG: hypothetical protein ACREBU_08330 [Nitrososphaera sp.]
MLALSFFGVRYSETIHRITMTRVFDESIFGSSMADSLVAIGLALLFLSIGSPLTRVRIVSIAIFAVAIAALVTGSQELIIGGLATLPVLTGILVLSALASRKARRPSVASRFLVDGKSVAAAFLMIIIVVEIGALARWISYPAFPAELYSDPSWRFAELESALFHSLGLLSPPLVALIAFSFFYKWYILNVMKRIAQAFQGHHDPHRTPHKSSERLRTINQSKHESILEEKPKSAQEAISDAPLVATYATKTTTRGKNVHFVLLSAALIIAPMLMIYPHLPGVNPSGGGVSTDEQFYLNWMSKLRADSDGTWLDTVTSAFTINKGDRPLTLLIILTISSVTALPDLMVIRYLPVALAPILVFANYVFIRHSLRHKDEGRVKFYASIGAIFAVFSPQIVVGQYAGLLANWLALVAAYFAFYFLIRAWESRTRHQVAVSFILLFTILFIMMLIHLYTWTHVLAAILLFAAISYVFARRSATIPKIKILVLLFIIGAAFSIDFARSSYFATPAATESDSALATNILPQDTADRWNRLYFTLSAYVGGFLSNPVYLILALVWVLNANIGKGLDAALLSLLFLISLPVALGSVEFQTRVLYDTPIHIPAVLALYALGGRRNKNGVTTHHLAIIAVLLVSATFALRAMANLYLVIPEGYGIESPFFLLP